MINSIHWSENDLTCWPNIEPWENQMKPLTDQFQQVSHCEILFPLICKPAPSKDALNTCYEVLRCLMSTHTENSKLQVRSYFWVDQRLSSEMWGTPARALRKGPLSFLRLHSWKTEATVCCLSLTFAPTFPAQTEAKWVITINKLSN